MLRKSLYFTMFNEECSKVTVYMMDAGDVWCVMMNAGDVWINLAHNQSS